MSDKIRRDHLERAAYVYVRQSTPHQVRNHLESKERQYGLAERAQQLGFSNVIVIDRYEEGIARLRFWPSLNVATAIPIILPLLSRIGPPLLPGEIGAVI